MREGTPNQALADDAGETEARPTVQRPSVAWRYKDVAFLAAGAVLFVIGVLGVTAQLVAGDPSYLAWALALCSLTGIAPGAILLLLGWRAHKEEGSLVAFSAWIKTYRRVALDTLAKNLGKTRFETEQILAKAADRGLVQGIVDRTTDEFVVKESIGQQIFVEQCPHCGAAIHRWFLPEDRMVCAHCNLPILARAAASTKSPPA